MPRTLSNTIKQTLMAQETGAVHLLLVTIDHDELAEPVRVVDNTQNITSLGKLFVGLPFDIDLPTDRDDEMPRVRVRIDNVERTLVESIESIATPPSITLEVVLASDPDTVEASFEGFTLRPVRYTALTIEGDAALEDILGEPWPAHSFSSADFLGMW